MKPCPRCNGQMLWDGWMKFHICLQCGNDDEPLPEKDELDRLKWEAVNAHRGAQDRRAYHRKLKLW